jgi:mannitol-specific phosphotransferase system IIBC component
MKHDIIHSLPFRIFLLEIDGSQNYWVHRFKDDEDFIKDMRSYNEQSKNGDPGAIIIGLPRFLESEGYINIAELVSEEYKAALISTRSRLIQKD